MSSRPIRVLAVGDCNTHGLENPPNGNTILDQFCRRLEELNMPTSSQNLGCGMACTREGIQRMQLDGKPADIALINFGLVDTWVTSIPQFYVLYYPERPLRKRLRKLLKYIKRRLRSPLARRFVSVGPVVPAEEFADNTRTMISLARQQNPQVQVVLWGSPPVQNDPERNQALESYNQILSSVAAETGALYVDTTRVVSQIPADQAYLDAVHLNAAATEAIAELICDATQAQPLAAAGKLINQTLRPTHLAIQDISMTLVNCTVPCNLCGSESAELVGTIDRDGQPLQTVLCQGCGLVWTDPRPDTEQTRKFYAEEYRLQYKSTYVPKLKHVYRETLRAIARFQAVSSRLRPGMKMLDVGSGGGFFPYVARQQGVEAQGIEPNEGFAEYAQATFAVPTTNAFFQDVDLPDESFDFISLNHVLEHVEDPCATLGQLRQWLRPEGFLVVEVPNVEATYHAPQNRYHVGHLYNFNPATLERIGEKAGLAVKESKLVTSADHVHVTFQKTSLTLHREQDALPENYRRVANVLKQHTTLSHYASPTPYTRFISKQLQYLTEKRAVRGQDKPREIADGLIASHLGTPARQAA